MSTRSTGRPKYSHFLCYRKSKFSPTEMGIIEESKRYRTAMFAVPDIFYRGEMIWAKGIGLDCCFVGVRFLRDVVHAKTVVDPFCGKGTVIAVANLLGVNALGVEISRKRCRNASRIQLGAELISSVSEWAQQISLDVVEQRRERDRDRAEEREIFHEEGEEDCKSEDDLSSKGMES